MGRDGDERRDRYDDRRHRDRDDNRRRGRDSRDRDRDRRHHRSPYSSSKSSRGPSIKDRRDRLSESSGSEDERRFDDQLEHLRQKKTEERRKRKEELKATETGEEKRIRRMAKKIQKEENNKLESASGISYNNLNNPFNDSNLTDTFVWNKKLQLEGRGNLSKREADQLHAENVRKNLREAEELRRNRDARQAMRDDIEMMARDRERAGQSEFTRVEYEFQVTQAKERTKIRLREQRPEPIDLLVRYSAYGVPGIEESFGEFELADPLSYIKGIGADKLINLIADIKTFKRIADHKDDEFWDDMSTICEAELSKIDKSRNREAEEAVNSAVKDDIVSKFKGKNYKELKEMKVQVTKKIDEGSSVFWQYILKELEPYMAKSRVKDRHRAKMNLKLQRIREEQAREMDEHQRQLGDVKPTIPIAKPEEPNDTKSVQNDDEEPMECAANDPAVSKKLLKSIPFTIDGLMEMDDDVREQEWASLSDTQLDAFTEHLYVSGRYSPTLCAEAMPGIEVIDEKEDLKQLQSQQRRNRTGTDTDDLTERESELLEACRDNMGKGEDEENFAAEEKLEKQTFLWSDKYRPRKPRYFNRVHTGFDWNKYNQTHYDLENPPPKIVKGYRFNIFYPDLLDIMHTPRYSMTECEDPDFAILRFKAGPPYEDIAFKIVNREWEVNHKHGFKNQFKDGVFQLWFSFKRYRYRR